MIAVLKRAEHLGNIGKHVRVVGETKHALLILPVDLLVGVDITQPIYAYEGDLELTP